MKRLLLGAVLLLIATSAIAATPLYGSRTAAIRNWPATIPTEGTLQESDPENICGVDITPTEEEIKEDSDGDDMEVKVHGYEILTSISREGVGDAWEDYQNGGKQ